MKMLPNDFKWKIFLRKGYVLLLMLPLAGPMARADENIQRFVENALRSPGSEVETAKIGTWDTATVDPMHVEVFFNYWFTGSSKKFDRNGGVDDRKLFRKHDFYSYVTVGLLKNADISFFQGYSVICDKEVTTDDVDGPSHGEGMTDLEIAPRWRFYEKSDTELSFAYVPIVVAPSGRRQSTDHLGPSQGYTSLQNLLVMTKNFGALNTDTTLGFTNVFGHPEKTGDLRGGLDFNFAFGYQLFQWLEPSVELHYGEDFLKHGKSGGVFDVLYGFLFPVNEHLRVDFGVAQDIAGYNRDRTSSGVFEIMLAI